MKAKMIPNPFRPGVGSKPKSTSTRPGLPQHARHCPVLEAGSALGYLVYPALRETETYEVMRLSPHRYQLVLYEGPKGGTALPVFAASYAVVPGASAARLDELKLHREGLTEEGAEKLAEALVVTAHFGTPAGGVGLRGSVFFRTPEGWDTVYASVINQLDPPLIPALAVRVETDWFSQDTEFRYVFQPGDVMQVSSATPIGQVFFVPREETALEDATAEDVAAFHRDAATFREKKEPHQTATAFGAFSPYYKQQQRGKG
jgi:hypothetical protein